MQDANTAGTNAGYGKNKSLAILHCPFPIGYLSADLFMAGNGACFVNSCQKRFTQ